MVQKTETGLAGIQEGTDIGAIVRARRTPHLVGSEAQTGAKETDATIDQSIPQSYDDLTSDEKIAYDALSKQFSRFDLSVGGYSYAMFKKHDCSGLVEELRASGFNVPDARIEAPELKQYLVVEVSPNERARRNQSCLGHKYYLKARFHSGLSRLMGEGAIPLNDESRVLGLKNTSTYDYQLGGVNLKVVYKA